MKERLREALRKRCGKHFNAKRAAHRIGAFVTAAVLVTSLVGAQVSGAYALTGVELPNPDVGDFYYDAYDLEPEDPVEETPEQDTENPGTEPEEPGEPGGGQEGSGEEAGTDVPGGNTEGSGTGGETGTPENPGTSEGDSDKEPEKDPDRDPNQDTDKDPDKDSDKDPDGPKEPTDPDEPDQPGEGEDKPSGGEGETGDDVDPGATVAPDGLDMKESITGTTMEWRKNEKDSWHQMESGSTIEYGDQLRFTLQYVLNIGSLWPTSELYYDTVYYKLPESLKSFQGEGEITSGTGDIVGQYSVFDGVVSIRYNEDYVAQNKNSEFQGQISFVGNVADLKPGDGGTVDIGFNEKTSCEVTVKPKPVDLEIKKDQISADLGENKINYRITLSTKDGTYGSRITLNDVLTIANPNKQVETGAKYTEETLNNLTVTKTAPDGDLTTIEKKNPAEEDSDGWSTAIAENGKSFALDLPALEAGESYTIEYSCDIEDSDKLRGDFTVTNQADASSGEGDRKSSVTSEKTSYKVAGLIYKTGKATDDHTVTWTVTLNANNANLNGYVLRDFLNGKDFNDLNNAKADSELVGQEVTVKRAKPGEVIDDSTPGVEATLPYYFGHKNGKKDGAVIETDNTSYMFIYTTPDTPQAGNSNAPWNRAYLVGPDQTLQNSPFATSDKVQISRGGFYEKKGLGITENPDGKTLTLKWQLTLNPVHTMNGWTLTDALQANQYFTPEQQEELKAKLAQLPGYENGHVEFTNNNKGFTVTGTGEWEAGTGVTIEYESTWNRPTKAGKYTLNNNATFENYTMTGTNYYYEGNVVQKLDVSTGTQLSDVVTNHEYHDLKNGKLVWNVVVTLSEKLKAADQFTITENLPEGVMLDSLTFKSGRYFGRDVTFTKSDDGSLWTANVNNTTVTANVDEGGRKVEITVPRSVYSNASLHNETMTLQVTVTPTGTANWVHDTTYKFPNKVTVSALSASILPEDNTADQEQDIFYNENYNAITKTGTKLTNALNQVQYQIQVNPEGRTYLNGTDRLKLTDTMTYSGSMALFLEDTKVHVYDYDYANKTRGAELSTDEYSYTYEEKNGQSVLVFRLPDSRPLLVEYVYRVKGTANQAYTLKNNAVLEGTSSQGTSSDSNFSLRMVESSGSVSLSGISLYKVDSTNYGKHLQGAVFRLEQWNPQTGTWETLLDNVTSDQDGLLKTVDASNRNLLKTGVAYRMVELTAPHGYELRMEPFDFYLDTAPKNVPEDYEGQLCQTGQRVYIPDTQGYYDPQITKDIVENGELVKWNTAKFGTEVQYQTTVQVAHGQPSKYLLHDAMSGLDFDEASLKITHQVKDENGEMIPHQLEEGVDYTLEKDCEDGCAFEIRFSDDRLIPGDLLTLTYSATVREDASLADEGNPNRTWLEYADPTGEDTTGIEETFTKIPKVPSTPLTPATPTKPDQPDTPSTPDKPDQPSIPSAPITPAAPVIPATPYEPEEPADSEEPASSDSTGSTEEPASSTTPDQPEQPAASVLPETPADSVNPGAPNPDNQDGWVMGAHGDAENPASSVQPGAPGPDHQKGWVLGEHGLIQTGQLNWPIPVLLALGGGLLLLGFYLNRKSRRHRDE